ncbi:MAG TPA: universal stress protein [Dyella sp.]|uniref:universal stress protein n=1 Tax=Dyella sp. TaxID=1869338 RepID=UPI002F947AEF
MAAFALARSWDSHVTGCFVDPALRTLRGLDAEPTVLSLLLEIPRDVEGEAEAFETLAHGCGVQGATWMATKTGLARSMHQLGAWHDLIVLERDIGEGDDGFDLLGEGLLGCRKPCLMLPPGWSRELAFERVALAWNGSLEATRAIHASLPFLKLAREVVVVDGAAPVLEDDGKVMPYFHPLKHLSRHGIAATRRRIQVPGHEAGDALLHEVKRMRADLLVMGAYGRSRLRERILGGATRRVLSQATLPVLMQH